MIVKAMENFSGKVSMSIGQVRDIPEGEPLPTCSMQDMSQRLKNSRKRRPERRAEHENK